MGKRLGRKCLVSYVPFSYLKVRVQVEYFRRQVRESEWYEITVCVDLEGGKGGEGEVRRSAGEL